CVRDVYGSGFDYW
nr:immunoglobulin heavy chain junction region [Macaca mulatta]MOW45586.1 immunoglobulin heavy chain junction region [Macaca mulatta]MOW45650.1 immunoglobulin heavy chain junction region [Macaca mulatta]MOW45833.1 immunoglobulin heavy chain junction region [Macaca mulatta]MOW45835.1 immunoglobulin heavy chain junction region [Macaca mulatta]